MNWYGGVWPHSKIPAKSSLTQKRFTLAQKSVREHSFQAITHDSARRVSKPGSLSPQDTFQVRILRAQVAQWGSPVSEDKGAPVPQSGEVEDSAEVCVDVDQSAGYSRSVGRCCVVVRRAE